MAEWREIAGWPGYEVSDAGEVRSWKMTRRDPYAVLPRILAPHRLPYGYLLVKLKDRGVKKNAYIHHLVAEAFHGPRPDGADVAHWDGDKDNNTPTNLRYATPKENGADSVRLGTAARGERHYGITALRSRTIRRLRSRRLGAPMPKRRRRPTLTITWRTKFGRGSVGDGWGQHDTSMAIRAYGLGGLRSRRAGGRRISSRG